jgi:HPr kinase/phosphorylase
MLPTVLPSLVPGRETTVRSLLDEPDVAHIVRLVAGENGLSRPIQHPRIQKSGLVLVGHTRGIVPTRVQVLGETEITYLESLEPPMRRHRIEGLFALDLSLVVVTRGVEMPELAEVASATSTPLVVATPRSSQTIQVIHGVLDRLLAPSTTVHGVLIDVHGIGMLLFGPSGIGKSECALFLLERGHRLIADDRVLLARQPSGQIVGRPPPLLRHHLEVRGVGIINARELFGATAVRESKIVQVAVELLPETEGDVDDRLGLDDLRYELLGASLPLMRIPVRPGRNMAVLLEVAARHQLLRRMGRHPGRELVERIERQLGLSSRPPSEDPE